MDARNIASCEIITIGDELNRGEITDTNSTFLAQQLTELGLFVRWRTSVTDDVGDMSDALRRAAARARVVVCSGGLGPTDDDRTVDVISGILGVTPQAEPTHEARMHARFAERGVTPTPNNLRQVRIPADATVLANATGLAPGFTVRLGNAQLSFLPGVPREMKPMFTQSLAPQLASLVTHTVQTAKRVFKLVGIGESAVDHALRGLLDGEHGATNDVTLHFRIAFPENLVTLVVRRDTADAATRALDRLSAEVERRLGEHLYGHDGETLPGVVGAFLKARGHKLAVAESCTGGMLGAIVTEVPGSSRWFDGGVIAYDNAVKIASLGVDATLIASDGAVSERVARAMADGVKRKLGADWALSITGVAGPDGGTLDKPVGTVWLAMAGSAGTNSKKISWPGEREQVRRMAAFTALAMLWNALR